MSTKIEYNGSIVATVEGGNKATLPVKDLQMKSDIMITVPEAESGTDSAIPIEVSTEAEMTALLENGEVGGVYKYTGTTGTYENGALYVLEEETESIVGTWVFNGEITGLLSQTNVSFESNGKTYSSISCVDSGFGLQVKYDSTIVCGKLVANEWVSDTYKTIIITSEPTDEAFITWLKANAVKQ